MENAICYGREQPHPGELLAENRMLKAQCGNCRARVAAEIGGLRAENAMLREQCARYEAQLARADERWMEAAPSAYPSRILKKQAERARGRKRHAGHFAGAATVAAPQYGRKPRAGDFLFYVVISVAMLVLFAYFSGGTGAPHSVLGFAAMRVLTGSMQDAIPMDSLIITRETPPSALAVGDDITFLRDAETTMTHRIVSIQENYANTGARGFQTQGIMNSLPDKAIVAAENVVGKVIFHSLFLGQAVLFIREYALWIGLFTALFIGLYTALRVVFSKEKDGARPE